MAHTPGPWYCDGSEIYLEENVCIAIAYRPRMDDEGNWMPNSQVEANARLIAAAPDLLRLVGRLREVFEQLSDGDWRHMDATYVDQLIESDGLRACAQAIAKAEGRTDDQV